MSGVNLATESIVTRGEAGHPSIDGKHLLAIHKQFGRVALTNFPLISVWKYAYLSQILKMPKIYKPLNWMAYDKDKAQRLLENEYSWIDYGTKHSESRFTKFYQEVYLPRKLNYDKRRLHLSSLIVAGQCKRSDAINILSSPITTLRDERRDVKFIAKKLGFTKNELEVLINAEVVSHQNYKSGLMLLNFLIACRDRLLRPLKSLILSK